MTSCDTQGIEKTSLSQQSSNGDLGAIVTLYHEELTLFVPSYININYAILPLILAPSDSTHQYRH